MLVSGLQRYFLLTRRCIKFSLTVFLSSVLLLACTDDSENEMSMDDSESINPSDTPSEGDAEEVGNAADDTTKAYKSAEVFSLDENLYGKYVIRMRSAEGSGIISNFFLWKNRSEMPDVFWEEVDIEVFGKGGSRSFQSNIITGLGERITSEEVHASDSSFAESYNTFSIEWTPGEVRWKVNGELVRSTSSNQVENLLTASTYRFNFWPADIPSWVGSWDDTILPVHMYVNWIEYHEWNGSEFEFAWRDDFDTFDTNRWIKANHTFAENLADFVPENANVKNGYLILSMTHRGEEGFRGDPPTDDADQE